MICQKTINDVFSPYWISIFYTRTKRKGNQFGVFLPLKTGEPELRYLRIAILKGLGLRRLGGSFNL